MAQERLIVRVISLYLFTSALTIRSYVIVERQTCNVVDLNFSIRRLATKYALAVAQLVLVTCMYYDSERGIGLL